MFSLFRKRPFFEAKDAGPAKIISEYSSYDDVRTFDTCVYVGKFLELNRLQESRVVPSVAYDRDIAMLLKRILADIRKQKLVLDFYPDKDDLVKLPMVGDPLRMQAILYWCSRLNASIPHLKEACARKGEDATPDGIKKTIEKIKFEDSMNKTDMFIVEKSYVDTSRGELT